MTYYSTKRIDKKKATYNVIFGERSNGKTFALLEKAIKNYFTDGSQFAYIRRWGVDIKGHRAARIFAGIIENNVVSKLSDGKFQGVHYWAGKYYLCDYDDTGKAIYNDGDCIGFVFAIGDNEHNKSMSFPKIKTIIFDEFLSKVYLPDEFISFMNTVSTIVRRRTDVTIYMLGNTVNKFSPYFKEMGLDNVADMKQGTIDLYHYGDSGLTVAVEYCQSNKDDKTDEQNKYYAFNNPKLEMITGGAWELSIYPHLPMKYRPKDVVLTFVIDFNAIDYKCDVVMIEDTSFIYIYEWEGVIDNPDDYIIYSLEPNPAVNYNLNLYSPMTQTQTRIAWFFKHNRVFYKDNNVGDAINNYLKVCRRVR